MSRTSLAPTSRAAALLRRLLLLPGCGGESALAAVGYVDSGASTLPGATGDASGPAALDAYIEEGHTTVTFVTVSCAEDCAQVQAVATGGNPPYAYAWDDGSTTATRRVCPASSTSYFVEVSDTAISGEFPRPAETVKVPLPARVPACPDAGATDASTLVCSDAGDAAAFAPSTVEVDPNGTTHYVMNGASLPAGHYRAEWVDGCMRWSPGGPMFGWDVNDPPPGVYGGPVAMDPGDCLLVTGAGAFVAALPGLTGAGPTDYPSCVANIPGTAPVDFDFAGGELGVLANDLYAADNVTGESAGGVSPTWKITLLSAACP